MQIDGIVNSNGEPVIKLNVGSVSVEALVDTGFNGFLVIAFDVARQLENAHQLSLENYRGSAPYYSATEEEFEVAVYEIEIEWLGNSRRLPVAISPRINETLIGSQLLEDCRLIVDYGHRSVTISESRS
jgi:clan AA aspartic protease